MERTPLTILLAAVVVTVSLWATGCPRQTEQAGQTAGLPPVNEPPTPKAEPVEAEKPASGKVQTISHGEEVELTDYLAKGKTTIFDFYSDGCGPCKAFSPRLEALAEKRDDIAVVVVDINRPGTRGIDWGSPVARKYNLESIPYLRVYGPDGKELARGDAAREMVEGWMQ
jgi:thiol-disulfide isomerase/thioredoxin